MPLLLFLALWPLPALAADFAAKVVGVSDGDTLTVLTAEKRQVKVRLHGVDAPETGQDFGTRAKQAASELAFCKEVNVREEDRDRYGRTVAEVILPEGPFAEPGDGPGAENDLVAAYAPSDRELAALKAEARPPNGAYGSRLGPCRHGTGERGEGVPVTAEAVGNRRSQGLPCPALPGCGVHEAVEPGGVR